MVSISSKAEWGGNKSLRELSEDPHPDPASGRNNLNVQINVAAFFPSYVNWIHGLEAPLKLYPAFCNPFLVPWLGMSQKGGEAKPQMAEL